jgi:hypothetical protein
MADPRIIRTSDPAAAAEARRLATQYEELDRAFGVPEPVNGTPQRPLTPLELAMQLLAETSELTSTVNLGRLEELTTAVEVLYGPGAGYPFRDAIGELGHKLSTARGHLARIRRIVAEEVDRLTAACDRWADDYRTVDRMAQDYDHRLADEQARRRHAEEVLRQLEALPGFLEPPTDVGVGYRIDTDSFARLRRLIKVHTDYVAGMPTVDPGPQPGPGPSLRDLLTELSNRVAGTSHGERLDLPHYCRLALDSIPADELDRRPGP